MARADRVIVCSLPLAKNAMHSPTSNNEGAIIIGERERANLVVRSSGIFCIVRRVCAHARLCTRFFLSKTNFRILQCLADRSSPRENHPPFDGMRCNLTDRGFVRASFYPKLFQNFYAFSNTVPRGSTI